MFGGVEVLCGVLIFRGIAAANVAARQAKTEMHPGIPHFYAFFAALGFWFCRMYMLDVRANIGHVSLLNRLFLGLNGDANLKASVAGDGGDTNLATDAFDDPADDIETKTGAFANTLGGEKRIEDAGDLFGRNPRAVIGNFHEDEIIFASGANGELAAAFHGVGGVVDEIGPDLIEFAAAGHDFGKIGSVVADDRDAAFELVIHDRKGGFEAALDVHFLHGALIHVGIFLDGFNEVGDACGAMFELFGDALHFEESGEASELGADGRARDRGKGSQMSVGEARIREGWRELPGILDVVRFEPRLNGFFALDASELVLELSGLQRRANFLFTFSQKTAVFRPDIRVASGFAQTGQAIAQSGGGTASGGGRIIEFVSEAGGKFAEG